jgi:hypothetical protein
VVAVGVSVGTKPVGVGVGVGVIVGELVGDGLGVRDWTMGAVVSVSVGSKLSSGARRIAIHPAQ